MTEAGVFESEAPIMFTGWSLGRHDGGRSRRRSSGGGRDEIFFADPAEGSYEDVYSASYTRGS